ncbi:MAG: glycerol-3-phosphate 1-O-acyltransferase PlsY [Candidatus Omnitrophica bacterium]|nr:glycerol-3-phosphate 1-O-acyltransferase PlsY [Candidatus Omnitrophota bacterium]
MLWIIIGVIASYLIGSIPTAYIFGRVLKGIDIRKFGSGNVGATNALRVLGKKAGITVLLLDVFKGVIPVIFLGNLFAPKATLVSSEALRILFGIACIFGHNWTIFLNFKGGKGVATTIGVVIGLSIAITGLQLILAMLATWLIVFLILRIVSIASVVAAVALPIYMFVFNQSRLLIAASIALCVLIILRHKPNLIRFSQGKEPKLKFRKK